MNSRFSSYFFFAILLTVFVVALFIFMPFLTPVLLALAAAIVIHPMYWRLSRFLGGGGFARTISALFAVVFIVILILVPLFFLSGSIYAEVQSLYATLTDEANRSLVIQALNNTSQTLSNFMFNVLPAKSFDSFNATTYIRSMLQWIFGNLDTVFSGLAKICGYSAVFLLAIFYFLRDGAELKKMILSWSPQLMTNEDHITHTFKRAVRSVFAGTLAVSVLEGLSIGFSFLVFGIPAPALWGTVALVAALVPAFGVTLLIIPAVAYLAISGNYAFALGMFLWGYAGVFIIDHFIGPNLINRGVRIHPFLVLLSVLGGLVTFGLIGFVLGPLVLVMLFTLLEIYKKSVGEDRV